MLRTHPRVAVFPLQIGDSRPLYRLRWPRMGQQPPASGVGWTGAPQLTYSVPRPRCESVTPGLSCQDVVIGFLVAKGYRKTRSETGRPIQTVAPVLDISILNAARPVYAMPMNCQSKTQGVR